jgi:gamma-glutamyl-gamma-aminobutyrate hydrolase PuuD
MLKLAGAEVIRIPFLLDLPEHLAKIRHTNIYSATEKLGTKQLHQYCDIKAQHLANTIKLISNADGLVIPGNIHDVYPPEYGEQKIHAQTSIPNDLSYIRFATEKLAFSHCYDHDKPILGICGGFQVANVCLGGSLVQYLPDIVGHHHHRDVNALNIDQATLTSYENNLANIITLQQKSLFSASHKIRVLADNKIAKLYQATNPDIDLANIGELNLHRQGMFSENISDKLAIAAYSKADDVVEAATLKDRTFGLFFQPHPECNVSGIAFNLITSMVDNCANQANLTTSMLNKI